MERDRYERKDYSLAKKIFKDAPKENTKRNLYEELSNHYTNISKSFKRKLNNFDNIFELAEKLALERRDRPKEIAKLRNELIFEYYYYRDSFLKKYMSKEFTEKWANYSIQRQFAEARKMAILDRFKNFRNAYGGEKIIIRVDGEEKEISIRTLFTMYKKGQITKNYLYDRINYFHDTVLSKYNTKEYRQRDGNAEFSRYASK